MRSTSKGLATAIAAAVSLALVLTGCAGMNIPATASAECHTEEVQDSILAASATAQFIASQEAEEAECSPEEPGEPRDLSQATLHPGADAMGAALAARLDAEAADLADVCAEEHTQVALDRSNYKVDPRGEKLLEQVLAKKVTPKEAQEKFLYFAGTNAQTLAVNAWNQGIYANRNDWRSLVVGEKIVDGGCLSEKGKVVFESLKTSYDKSTEFEFGTASDTDTNSGINGDQFVVASEAGIGGNRKTVTWTTATGRKVSTMIRCLNIHFAGKPPAGIPKGKTDNPEPEPPDHSKDSEPWLYPQPGSGRANDGSRGTIPPAAVNPAEGTRTPGNVQSEVRSPTGGGSAPIVESPTRQPSSETGVTAPGATVPSTPARPVDPAREATTDSPPPDVSSPPPSEEDADAPVNEGTVGGF